MHYRDDANSVWKIHKAGVGLLARERCGKVCFALACTRAIPKYSWIPINTPAVCTTDGMGGRTQDTTSAGKMAGFVREDLWQEMQKDMEEKPPDRCVESGELQDECRAESSN